MWISRKRLKEIQNKIATLEREQEELLLIVNKHVKDEKKETQELIEILSQIKRAANAHLVEQSTQRSDTH